MSTTAHGSADGQGAGEEVGMRVTNEQEYCYQAQCRGCKRRATLREPVVFVCGACHGELVPLLTPEQLIWAYPAPDRDPLGDPLTALRDAALRVHHEWATERTAYGLEDAMILMRQVLQAIGKEANR